MYGIIDGRNLMPTLIGGLVGLVIGALIGAMILRGAVALYNKFAGGPASPNAVREPSLGQAVWIVLAAAIVNVILYVIVATVVSSALDSRGQSGAAEINLIAQTISLLSGLLVMAAMLTSMLPTSFRKAVLITLCHLLVSAFVVIVIGGIVFAVASLTGMRFR